jgi:cystathionine gamma-synthase
VIEQSRTWNKLGFETKAIHVAQEPDAATGAVVPPIHLASTFGQEEVGTHKGYEYARTHNPTREVLETVVAALESADHGVAFASGMAAVDAVLRRLRPGDHLLIPSDAYGGTYRLVARILGPMGIEWSTVDLGEVDEVIAAWRPQTRLVWVESPSNPLLGIADITALAELAHERGAICVVDNTFATPFLQQPLDLGADVVVHSSTKYLGGHSDVVGGVAVTRDGETAEELRFVQNSAGAVPGPFDCYLVLRGLKTLAIRMERQCASARAVAELLDESRAVERVYFPGLPGHRGHDIARRQMRDFGAMVSFVVPGGEHAALDLVKRTHVFTLAESLGAVESLIEHPARMTHASVVGSPLAVDTGLVRLSVGLETLDDLLGDLEQALGSAGG